jgi:hypothetical protein
MKEEFEAQRVQEIRINFLEQSILLLNAYQS